MVPRYLELVRFKFIDRWAGIGVVTASKARPKAPHVILLANRRERTHGPRSIRSGIGLARNRRGSGR
ncbi:hypothetical protein Psuf_004980 [Phytohabitans suffuscus]|uniref:Uncharacterized protein n=1 Tax=Phytohabitans suffuscus TaxID=624315 RepID=A0A6F8YAQ6_9ACTN|nr:hypothetical protein Psuf_004980 [Phytohabitans suffuscus]